MFKCKITLEEFDKEDKKGESVELNYVKSLAKACVKKLATSEESKTPFFLSKDYFEDKGKAIGSFLAFGENKKLEMKFAKEEIKGKGTTQNAKGAAYGEAYVKTTNNIQFICFEPDDACKIPANTWPKLLKSLKSMFGGMKAMVIMEGQSIAEEEDDDKDENDNNDNTSIAKNENNDSKENSQDPITTKTLKADKILKEIKDLSGIYAIERKERLVQKIIKWLDEYKEIGEEQRTPELKSIAKTMEDTYKATLEILKKDAMVKKYMDQILDFIDQYLKVANPDIAAPLANKIKQAIEKVKPLISSIQDKALLKECEAIINVLK